MSYLVKVGGSLIPFYLPRLCHVLKKSIKKSRRKIFLFPGGGEFADLIRKYRKLLSLCDETTHKMALACLDQNAYLIADICKCRCVSSMREIRKVKEFPVIIAPYKFLKEKRPFYGYNLNIDVFSSDSSAAYMAYLLKADLVIATDVAGIYERDPKGARRRPRLLRKIDAGVLQRIKGGGPLDETIPELIDKYKICTWVIDGRYPSRIACLIKNRNLPKGTLILP